MTIARPTPSELELLKQLWKREPKTARELHETVGESLGWTYSTTRKTLERMGEKDFVNIKDKGNKKIYFSKLDKLQTLAGFAHDFASRIFELDRPLPIALFGDSKLMSDDEISELEGILQEQRIKAKDNV